MIAPATFPFRQITFEGDRMWASGDENDPTKLAYPRVSLSFVADPTASPPIVDLAAHSKTGTGDGEYTMLGIYRIEGDELTIRNAAPGKPRPTDFLTDPNEAAGEQAVLRRIRPERIAAEVLNRLRPLAPAYTLDAAGQVVEIDLSDSALRDAQVAELARLTALKRLYLRNTAITDGSIENLAKLQSLEFIDFSATSLTSEGANRLLGRLPKSLRIAPDPLRKQP